MGEVKQTTTPICTTRASNPSTPVTTTVTSNPQSSVLCNPTTHLLLKTAVTKIKSDKTRSATANILFDEGPQRSLISQQLADVL